MRILAEHVKPQMHNFNITIQTNIGMKSEPKKTSLKYWVMVQSLLSYVITIGFLYVIIKSVMKGKNGEQ
jgi:hypothetical protein